MRYRIFSQASEPSLPLAALEEPSARIGAYRTAEQPDAPLPAAIVEAPREGAGGIRRARLFARPRTPIDLDDARAAARSGRAAGMDDLAARCPTVIEVEGPEPTDEAWLLELCAALAAASLGPILPPDGATLLGVRSARVRARR